jgi:hypothetical protein
VVGVLRVVGIVLAALGGLVTALAIVWFVSVQLVDEHCPPTATCDAKGLLSFVGILFGGGGLVTAGVGGVLVLATKSRPRR